ncbi:MAG: hypothetical protein IPF99_05840 [Deltaproteobacteria bacterium]|nr:hypothetical protein [Deltaproteobacteria bacterium]
MMNTRINRWSLVLWATALGAALAGCSDGQSVVGGPADAAVANDLRRDVAGTSRSTRRLMDTAARRTPQWTPRWTPPRTWVRRAARAPPTA